LRLWKFHSFSLGLAAISCALELVEKKRIKEFLKKVKKILDKILFCGIVTDIEKCAPTQSGRFAFQGGSLAAVLHPKAICFLPFVSALRLKTRNLLPNIAAWCVDPPPLEPSCLLIKTRFLRLL